MTHIMLSEEQSQVIEQAQGPVEIRDSRGRAVAQVRPLSAEDLEMIESIARATEAIHSPNSALSSKIIAITPAARFPSVSNVGKR